MKDELLSPAEWKRVFDELGVPKYKHLNRSTILTGAAIERLACNPELQGIVNRLQLDVNDSITLTIIEPETSDGAILQFQRRFKATVICL
jgi:hypothetical protein